MRKVAFAIDGWFLRKVVYKTKAFYYNGSNIRRYCTTALRPDDVIYRIFYYDTEPLIAKGHNPITRNFIDFETTPVASGQKALLQSIRETPNFALRLGKTTWDKSWLLHPDKFKDLIDKKITAADLVESDVRPNIRQKAVDMKMGMDIALISLKKQADVLIIITGDADIVPALKLARREGMQVGLDPLDCHIRPELREHVDFVISQIKQEMFKVTP